MQAQHHQKHEQQQQTHDHRQSHHCSHPGNSRLEPVCESCVNNNYIVVQQKKHADKQQHHQRNSRSKRNNKTGSTMCWTSICYPKARQDLFTIVLAVSGFLCKEQSLIVLLISSVNHFLSSYYHLNHVPGFRNNKRHESLSPSRIKSLTSLSSCSSSSSQVTCSSNCSQAEQHQQSSGGETCSCGIRSGVWCNKRRSGSSSSATDSSPSDSPILRCRIWKTSLSSHYPPFSSTSPSCSSSSFSSSLSSYPSLLTNRCVTGGSGGWSFKRKKSCFKSCLVLLSGFTCALIFRILMSGGSPSATFNRFDNPASVEPVQTQILTYGFLSAFNFGLLLFPNTLSCDWTHSSLPVIDSLSQLPNLITIIFYVSLLFYLISLYLLLNHRTQVRQQSDYPRQVCTFSSSSC